MDPIIPSLLPVALPQLPIKDASTVFQGRKFSRIDADFADPTGHLLATIQGVNFGKVETPAEKQERDIILTPDASDIVLYGEEPSVEPSKIIQNTGDLKLISENGTIWSKNGCIYAPDKKVIIFAKNLTLEDFDIIAKEVEIHVHGEELAQFTNVRILTQGAQSFDIDEADFQQVLFDAQEGKLNLSLPETGLFSSCILVARKDSIECSTDGTLQFENTQSLAKKEIRHEAADIVNKDSSFAAGENINQYAESELKSSNSSMVAENGIILDGDTINTDGLTASAGAGVRATSTKQGRFVASRLHSDNKVSLTSESGYVDMSRSEINTKHFTAEAEEQILLPRAKVRMDGKAEFISKELQIEAQGTEISSPENANSELSFQAKQGTIYLDHNQTHVGKVGIAGKYVHLGNSNISSLKDAEIHAKRIEGQNVILTSEEGSITAKGEKSLQLDNVFKRALKISEESQQWLSEKNNENESQQIKRAAQEMDLVDTKDTAAAVHLAAGKRFNASGYVAKASEAFTLDGKGSVRIEDSAIETQKMALQANELWLSRNHFNFDQFLAQSRALNMQSNVVNGNASTFETREGVAAFYHNAFKARFNQIKAQGCLSMIQNEAEGKQDIQAKEDLMLSQNAFAKGSLELKSEAGNVLVQNSVFQEMTSVEVEAPQGAATFSRVGVKSDKMTIQAPEVGIHQSRLESNTQVEGEKVQFDRTAVVADEKIEVKGTEEVVASQTVMQGNEVKLDGGQAVLHQTQLQGTQAVALKSDHADVTDSTILSEKGTVNVSSQTAKIENSALQGKEDVTVQADQSLSALQAKFISQDKTVTVEATKQHLEDVALAGTDIVQTGVDVTNLDTEAFAKQSLQREATTLLVQGGVDEAKSITEKAQTGTISERKSQVEDKHQIHIDKAMLFNNTISGSEIEIKGGLAEGPKNLFEANTVKLESDINMPQTKADASLIKIKPETKAALPLSHLKGAVDVNGGNVDLTQSTVEGSIIIKTDGDVEAPNLDVKKAKVFGVEANNIWMPNVKVDAEKIVGKAQAQADFSRGTLKGKEIGLAGKDVHASQLQAEAEKDVLVQAQNRLDANGATLKAAAAVDVRGEDINLDESEVTGDSITEVARSSLSAENSTQKAAKDMKVASKDLRIRGAELAAKDMHFQASGFANMEGTKVKAETLTATAHDMHAPNFKGDVNKEATLQATEAMNLQDSIFKVGKDFDARANYLSMDRSQVDAKTITEVGTKGLSADESHQKAEKDLIQDSDKAIHAQGSHLEADTIRQQATEYIDHRNAENVAKKNVIITSFFDNREGTLNGDTQAKTTVFDNSHGHFFLLDETSFIETDHLFNDHHTTYTGIGSLGIQTPYRHEEQSAVDIIGTYQLVSGGAVLDSSIKAKDVFVNASDNRVVVTKQGDVASKSATFIGSQLHNAGKLRAEVLEIDQKDFRDIGDAIGSEHLIHRVDSSIMLHGMKTPGSLTLVSRQGEIDVGSLNIGNDLTLQAQRGIHIDHKVQAAGRGVLLTPGMCHFDHAKVSFKNGIDADVGTFYSQVSDIDVMGRSKVNSIQCQNFRLEGEGEVPLYRANSAQRHAYTPSNFYLEGDLYFKAKNKAENIGSNFLVDGNAYVAAKTFDNKNVEHNYSRLVEAGSYKTRKLFKKKRKTLHKSEHHIVVDSYANTQISGTAELNIGTLNNTGIFLTGNTVGKVGHLENGIQSNQGQVAPLNPASIPMLKGLPTPRAGGDFQAADTIQLKMRSANNTGFIEAGNIVDLKIKRLFHNRKRLAEEHQDAIRKKKHGKVKTHNVAVDHIQPGGVVKGRVVRLKARKTKNQGGLIEGRDHVNGSGGSFDNEALKIRTVNPSNQRAKDVFHRAELLSGGTMNLNYTSRFKNVASDVIAWNGLDLTAGNIIQRSLFAVNVEQDKKGWKKRKLEHSIEMEEGKIWSIKGPLNLKSTKGDIDIEGELGTFEGHLSVDSARDILFGARTVSAENKVSGWKAGFGNVSWQQTKYNTTKSSLPHVFAGAGANFKGRNLLAEGLRLDVIGDVEGELKKSVFKSHKVEHYVKTKGVDIGVQAFGVQAVQAALNHEKPSAVGRALLNEDPAVSSVFKLAGSRDGADVVKNGVGSAVKLWNEAANFASAYNQDKLGSALGSHFGLTDGDGNLFPKVSVSADFTKTEQRWTTSAPSQLNIQGNWKWHVGKQIYQGAEINVSENADLQGDVFVGEADSDTFSTKSKGIKPSVSFGPNGIGVGMDYHQSSSKQRTYSNFKLNVGKKLNMHFKNSTRLSGAEVEAGDVYIKTPHLIEESKQNTSSQKHFNVGASTDGRFTFGIGSESSREVNRVTFIKARKQGVIDADYMKLIGANTQNIQINAKKFEKQDLKDVNKGRSFSVEFALPQKPQGKDTPPQGLNYLGEVDFKSHRQEVNVNPVVSGGNGKVLGVETNLAKQREVVKDQRMHVGAPLVTLNREALRQEVQEMRRAFNLDPAPQPIMPVQEEIKQPEKPKVKKEKKPVPEVKVKKLPTIKEVAEAPEIPLAPLAPIAMEPAEVKAVKKDSISDRIEFALLANEREDAFDLMIAEGLKKLPGELAKKACNVDPRVHNLCKKVGIIFKALPEFVHNHILPNDPEALANRERNILRDALFKEERLGIPKKMTMQYHRDMESSVVNSIVALPIMALGMKIPGGNLKGRIADFIRDESGAVKVPNLKSRISKEMVDAFEDIGYAKVTGGGKGSHTKLVKPGYPMAIIPHERELPKGTAHSIWKTYQQAKKIAEPAPVEKKVQSYQPKSNRMDYSREYANASREFALPPKEFEGVLKKDLVLVNYHSGEPLGGGRSHKWATVPTEVNPLRTVEAVKDRLGLLDAFGDRTHVSVARITAGEKVKFLHGRAAKQIDPISNELRPGGGVQYRFFDFDPKWIVETRAIPGVVKKKN